MFFHRLRLSVRGQIIEDIQDFSRVSHMLNLFERRHTRLNDTCEGFGYFDDVLHLDEVGEIPGIRVGLYQTVMFKPLCGLFNQSKYLPLRYMPIELELKLADNGAPSITDFNHAYSAETTSTSWKIQNCQMKCDILSFDNSLDKSYDKSFIRR